MRTLYITFAAVSLLSVSTAATDRPHPEKFSRAEISGDIFKRPDMVKENRDGRTTEDVLAFTSSDKTFTSGMYKASAGRYDARNKDYGVDEFMYFLEGSVTLTSLDGTVMVVGAGEAVTIAKEWRGLWETDGYTKIYVIYDTEGTPE